LSPYSDSMHSLLKNGYKAKRRPSGHDISTKFSVDNGGSVPPNLLAIANTESNGKYQDYCREHGYPVHPARFPATLPEYFIRMLTDKGDLIFDPFGGSCVTGEASERLERDWITSELDENYLLGAMGRFQKGAVNGVRHKPSQPYTIYPPCTLPLADKDFPLPPDGGKKRPSHIGKKKSFGLDFQLE
jgi:DNA modification methylase